MRTVSVVIFVERGAGAWKDASSTRYRSAAGKLEAGSGRAARRAQKSSAKENARPRAARADVGRRGLSSEAARTRMNSVTGAIRLDEQGDMRNGAIRVRQFGSQAWNGLTVVRRAAFTSAPPTPPA
jgi:hypothetical protein